MAFVERVVLAIGFALLVVAVVLALVGRSPDVFLWSGAGLIVLALFRGQIRHLKLGPGGVEVAIDEAKAVRVQLAEQTPDLKLLIATAIPVGMAETIMGSSHVIQLTAVNTGAHPIGVSSLGLELSDGRWMPFPQPMPTAGSVPLPAVLNPQQTASVWADRDSVRDSLREERVRPSAIIAYLADGSTRRQPVPEDWARLGDVS